MASAQHGERSVERANALIGSAVQRIEDLRFLTGKGTYVADLARDGALHAVILRSTVAHARIKGIDIGNAAALKGVAAIITAKDIGDRVPLIPIRQQALLESEPYRQPVIAVDKVRYVGEPMAMVLAIDAATAEDALELISLDLEELPAIASNAAARSSDVRLFEASQGNRPIVFFARKGDSGRAFSEAFYTCRRRFSVQRHMALPMETRGILAEWNADRRRLLVHGAAKVPFFNRRALAGMLGLSEAEVDLIEVDVGGGFGARGEFYPEDFLIPFAAKHLQCPVRWIEDRREHLMAANHARQADADVEIACDKDGCVLGLRGTIDIDIGAYVRTNGFTAPRNVAQFMSGPYDVANITLDSACYVTNKTPSGTYRGPGRFEAAFFIERLFDIAAKDLGIDPAEFRKRNLIPEAKMPYKLAQMRHVDPGAETWCDGGVYAEVLDRCLAEFDWNKKLALQGQCIDGRYHGIGLGCFIDGGASGPREGCRMTVEPDGTIAVHVGSSAIGQGLETVLSQIAADALGLPMSRIRLRHGSTTLVNEGFGSFHSRSTVMGGSAILVTAEKLLAAIKAAAARKFACPAEHVAVHEDKAIFNASELSFAEIATEGICVEASFSNSKYTYSYGTHAVHVAVDPRTGHVDILDYVAVEDVGRIINPATLRAQVVGAVAQGLGSVFMEHLRYDDNGQLLTGTLADYLIPTATDVPRVRAVSLGLRPCPNNPLGAKGAGEGGLIPTGGAVANAVAAALADFCVEPHHLPLTPATLWRLIQAGQRRAFPASDRA
jgi:carbon-monoxide dehydrogenase large subunit